jgi:hypothetical protein
LACGADEALSRAPLSREALEMSVYKLLKLPLERPAETVNYEHARRWPRVRVSFPARLSVYRLAAPRHRDRGEALIENISRGGAFLSRIRIEAGVIPAEPFRFLLEVDEPPLVDWRAHCQVVRLQSIASLTAAVQFVKITRENVAKIAEIPGA